MQALENAKENYKERTKNWTNTGSRALHIKNLKSHHSDLSTKLTEFAKKVLFDIDTILKE